jgi:hypothetical protein
MADDIAMVERIYGLADQPFTYGTRQAMTDYMLGHPRNRHGKVTYDLGVVGLDESERRHALTFSTDRFLS